MVRGPEIQEAEKLFDRTPWGLRLWPLAGYDQVTRVGFLASLLSNEWLAERHIDTFVAYLNDQLRRGDQPGVAFVADQYLGSLLSRKRNETAPVLTLYSKEAGAGSRHAWQESTTSIGAISYLVVRAYEVVGPSRNLFRLIHSTQAKARAETFMHLPSAQFLCRIQQQPILDGSGNIIVSEDDWSVFRKLAGDAGLRKKPAVAIKKLSAAKRRGGE